ncbi:MAG: PQQ-like beta-propeller repeat protein [Planctomycetales bacterium]|nr:PQQ-like beta-propeller repeat protein [Planctomycetales bacterium]
MNSRFPLRAALLSMLSVIGLIPNISAVADDWPQWMGPSRDGVWRETGIVETFPKDGPTVRWRVQIGGGYAGPAVVGDRVFVTDKLLPEGAANPSNPFERGQQTATERVLCLSDADGSVIWKHEYPCRYTVSYPAGPRTTPVVKDGRVYTLGSEGHLLCLDADKGAVIWSKDFKTEYGRRTSPVWGYSANPLLDGDRLICLVGGEGTTVVAFHKDTGKELWRALDSSERHGPGYGSPIIVETGGQRQLIVWHPSAVSSLDPISGKLLWNQPFDAKEGLTVATPRISGDKLFISAFYDGSLLLKLDATKPDASVVWRRHGKSEKLTDALHCLISTPVIDGNHIYGVCSHGELRCLDLATGDRKWSTFQPTSGESLRWGTAFIVKHEDRYFLFSEQGDLIIARFSPTAYTELSRAHLLEPTGPAQRREVVWSHPAFANRSVYARNDKEIVSVSLAKP